MDNGLQSCVHFESAQIPIFELKIEKEAQIFVFFFRRIQNVNNSTKTEPRVEGDSLLHDSSKVVYFALFSWEKERNLS